MSQAGLVDIEGSHPQIPTQFDADTGSAVPILNVLNIFGTSAQGISTSASGNTVTLTVANATTASKGVAEFNPADFTVSGGIVSLIGGVGFTWQVVTSAMNPITLSPMNGYICKGGSPVDFILPASAAIGDEYWIKGIANLWTIAQNAAQTISLGFSTTTAGVGGSVTATQVKDAVQIICVTTNTGFEVLTAVGNPTIV